MFGCLTVVITSLTVSPSKSFSCCSCFPLNQTLSIFSPPLPKNQCQDTPYQYQSKMCKRIKTNTIRRKAKASGHSSQTLASNQKLFQQIDFSQIHFLEILKELPQVQAMDQRSGVQQYIATATVKTLQFYNYQKNYTQIELTNYTICLANLINLLGEHITAIAFQKEVKHKLKRIIQDVAEEEIKSISHHAKVQAVFFILGALVFQQKIKDNNRSLKELNKCIYADSSLVRTLLSISLPKNKKISKFYGVVVLHLSGKNLSKKMKEMLLKSVLINFGSIDHQPTLFNLLVHLRSQKHKVKINLKDLLDGHIFQMLMSAYPKYIHHYQSYYILDYLHFLINLFPSLATQTSLTTFISYLIASASPSNLHHPLHQSTIIGFTNSAIRYSQQTHKQAIINEIASVGINNTIMIKLAQILISFGSSAHLLTLVERGYFWNFTEIITPNTQKNILQKIEQLFTLLLKRVSVQLSPSISIYLLFRLNTRLTACNFKSIDYPIQE